MADENKKRGRPTGSKNKAKKKPSAETPFVDTFTKQIKQVVEAAKQKSAVSKPKKKATGVRIIKMATGARRESGVAGAKDTKFPAKFSLIPARGLQRIATTCGEGFLKYGQGNWLNGFKETELLDHAEAHLNEHKKGDKSEDHIAHAVWNLLVLMHIQETEEPGSELLDLVPQKPRKEHQKRK